MNWLFPAGAVASIALIAIVVLHMRHRLPEVLTFPQLSFWPRVPSESRESPRWRKPPITLLFLLQLLAALLLVLAFMRPALPGLGAFGVQRTSAMHHVIVLDGSTSMLARSSEGDTHWDTGKAAVDDVLGDWQQGDGITLVVASSRPIWKSAVDERQLGELRDWLDDLSLPGGVPDEQALSAMLSDVALPDLDQHITLITDGGIDTEGGNAAVDRVVLGEPGGNVAIISTSMSTSGDGGQAIDATVLHDRPGTETLAWVARSSNAEIASGTITLASGESGAFTVPVPGGVERVSVEVRADDALPDDNHATVSLGGDVLTGIRIVLISDVPGPTERALAVLPGAVVESYPSTTPGIRDIAANADIVVYEASAPTEGDVPDVPMLLVQPTGVTDYWQITGVSPNPEIADVALDDPAMRDISLDGVVFGETPVYLLDPAAEVLASGAEADSTVPLIWRGAIDGQPYIAYAFDPSLSNIANRVTFPVLVAQSVFSLSGEGGGSVFAPGDLVSIDVPGDGRTVRVTDSADQEVEIPVVTGADGLPAVTFPVTARPGVWSVVIEDQAGAELNRGSVVVNAGDVRESRLSSADPAILSLAGETSDSTATVAESDRILADIWPLLVLAAIAVIGLEWWIWLARSAGGRRATGGQAS